VENPDKVKVTSEIKLQKKIERNKTHSKNLDISPEEHEKRVVLLISRLI